ncbi:VCBS repeat protein [Pacificibacter maritimus]|uniref:VCBS repeat protein n=1 Tax=Pacificibacter maritimus TaxID=762213 RepID=A0A3N4UW05_9RHOB|nr:CRTAC1 family protein [Pacificibacter maritimus]RPE71689.1 VCBS repeat protein [Pacificibacter maritimus]
MKRLSILIALVAPPALCDPTFEDLSQNLPELIYSGGWTHFVGGGLAVLDCNNDALPDIFASGGERPAKLIRNDGQFIFTDMEVPQITGATGAYPIDIDADGILDLFVLRVGPNKVLKGQGNCTFTEATDHFGMPENDAWSTAFTAWWATDSEGPTMAIGNYVDRKDPDGPFEACDTNTLLLPKTEGYQAVALEPAFCPLSMLASLDARGRKTLRISNDRHYYVEGGFEQMLDIEEQRFLNEKDGWPKVSLWGMGIASRDLTGDGLDEVMLTSMGDQVLQFAGADGTYRAANYDIGTYAQRPHLGDDGRPSTGWHAEFGDMNNDALPDLFIAKGNVDQMPSMAMKDPNNLLMQHADGVFHEAAAKAGLATTERSRGAALVDFDLDGLLDVIVSNRRAPLEIYRNTSENMGNWITVDLQQSGPNRNAIGAVITVKTDHHIQTIQHTIGGGHAGGQLLARHFGLGDSTQAKVFVDWPDGSRTQADFQANSNVKITKP